MNGSVYIGGVTLKRLPENDDYLRDIPAVRHLIREKHIAFTKPVTFLVGENGTGKSTLLEAIAVAYGFNAEGGTKNFNFSTRNTRLSRRRLFSQSGKLLQPCHGH